LGCQKNQVAQSNAAPPGAGWELVGRTTCAWSRGLDQHLSQAP